MSTKTLCILVAAGLALSVFLTALAQDADTSRVRQAFRMEGGVLKRGGETFTLRAVETPGLVKTMPTLATLAPPLNRLSAAGANTVCFNLYGLSADGAGLAKETVDAVEAAMAQISWRRIGVVCRVFDPNASPDAAYRLAAVGAVARAFKDERRLVYWIDGPNCSDLVKAFKKEAPDLVVAAPEGGDITVVTTKPKQGAREPVLLVGALPDDAKGSVHFVLPDTDASYAALDAAMADPVESQPWQPDNSMVSEQERAEGWTSLFDGKSLTGWWVAGTNKKGFEARDGNIEWAALGASMLLTRDRYADFVLRLEWRIRERGNSGIFIRAPRGNRASKIGMEIQLQGDYGSPVDIHTTAAVYDVVAPTKNASKPAGEWNDIEIMVKGSKLKITMNGEVVQDINLDDYEELKYRLREGFIGLQDHGRPVSFRNIRVKKL